MNFQLDYTNYDFESLEAQLVDLLNQLNAWKDRTTSSNGIAMIDLLAGVANMLMYSIERHRAESYKPTARLRSSVINLVKIFNYAVSRAVSSTGTVRVSIATTRGYDVYIPRWTQFQTADGYKFSAVQDYYITAGQLYVDVNVIQGIKGEQTVASTGYENQAINIPFENVENTSVEVRVDGTLWTKVETFLLSEGVDQVYTEVLESDDTVTVNFGNNIQGKIPSLNSSIVLTYCKSDGAAGNVFTSGQITTIVDRLYDTHSVLVTNASVTNSGSLLGAADPEGTEHIRYYAPQIFATGQRAVTKEDFAALISTYGGVADAYVWGERENSSSPDYDSFNKVYICVILQGWLNPDDTFKTALGTFLYDQSLLTVKYEFVDASVLDVIVCVDLYCATNSDLGQIRANTTYELGSQFNIGDTTRLGVVKYLSDLTKTVNAIEGVNYSHVVQKIQKQMTYNPVGTKWEVTLPLIPAKAGSIEILYNGALIAYDDGFNLIKNVPGGSYVVTGQVDYTTTGYGYVQVSGLSPTATLYVRYQQPNGDITPTKNNICRLFDVEYGTVAIQ